MTIPKLFVAGALSALVLPALAAVTAEEAAKLKGELTPFGAEKAGNKDGSIPAWTGGYTTPISGDKPGGRRGDPFAHEKPLFSITAKNADQYADKLTDGQKAMLKKYPDYRLDVYPTHRTAAAPKWVYDNTFKNATTTRMTDDIPSNFYGGYPFPIPKSGVEVMWNHVMRWRSSSWQVGVTGYQLTATGKAVMSIDGLQDVQAPIYMPDGSWEAFDKTGPYWEVRYVYSGPPLRAGEGIVGGNALNSDNDRAWVYLAGQRRTRKLPNACCDTPHPATGGMMSFDELEVWTGRTDRFDWKIVGKKEAFVPYNNNRLLQPRTDAEVIGPHYVKPEFMRFELHRVWVVESTLKAGQRHQAARSRYYCDEDTWQCLLADRWDAKNQLWKTLWLSNFVAPDVPGTLPSQFGFTDLISGNGYIANLYNSKPFQFALKPRYPESTFSPDSLAGASGR
jgi:hypothetical protein